MNAEDTCADLVAYNEKYGGEDNCRNMAEEKEYVFVAGGECAVDHCYIYGIDWCRDSGCVDLMGSWDCPTKETCDGMRAVKEVLEDWIDAAAPTEPVPAVMKKT